MLRASHVLTCAGLQADQLAELTGCKPEPRIIPFRYEYLQLDKSKSEMIKVIYMLFTVLYP